MSADLTAIPLLGPVVAIDGPSGAGKSTIARQAADRMAWGYLDTGATYRVGALWCEQLGLDFADHQAVAQAISTMPMRISTDPRDDQVWLGDSEVTAEIRTPHVASIVSQVATNATARRVLGVLQRQLMSPGQIVAEGRDITTVVAPDAPVRILLTARPEVRLARRAKEITGSSDAVALAAIQDQVLGRDAQDSTMVNFATPAAGVVLLDTSNLTIEAAITAVVLLVQEHYDTKQ